MTQADKQSGQQPVARKGGLASLASWSGRQWCLLGALGCAFLLGVAFVLQFAFDLAPCSLCIFQRVAVAVAGVFFLLGALHGPGRVGTRIYALGALAGSTLSVGLLSSMEVFKPVFAILVFFIAAQLAWQLLRTATASVALTKTMSAAEAYERHMRGGGESCERGVMFRRFTPLRFYFRFGDEDFTFSTWLPFFTGMGIAVLSSALGVGGGFLLVPFMSIVMRLPMYVIAGTSALAIAMHSVTSIANYMRLGVELDLPLLAVLLVGVVAGSAVGPFLSKYIPENGLRGFLAAVLLLIGLRYAGLL